MRFLLLVCLFAPVVLQPAHAQTPDTTRQRAFLVAYSFTDFAQARTRLDQRGLRVLGGWAVGNLIVSGIATGQTEGSAHYFHQMNLGWGAVNLALAGAGYLAARRAAHSPVTTRADNVRRQLKTENLYLLNAGLDVAYLAAGAYFLEKGRNPTASGLPSRWRGYGQSLVVQGGFLLLFDGIQYAAHHRHANRGLYPLLSRVSLGPGAVAVVLPLGREVHRLKALPSVN